MRTTINLAPDLAAALRKLARERATSMSEVVNATLRRGLGAEASTPRAYRLRTYPMGLRPGIDVTRALALAAALEDDELVRKLELRK